MNDSAFLIIRLSSLGDIIHALPAFSALREKFPHAHITWLAEEKGSEILECVPGIDRIVTARTKQSKMGLRKILAELSRIKKEIRQKDQIALDFQGLIKSGLFAFLSHAKKRIGFHKKNLKEPLTSVFYNDQLDEISENIHVIDKNLALLSRIGIQTKSHTFPLILPEKAFQGVQNKLTQTGFQKDKRLVVFNLGAAWPTKRLSSEKWAEVIEAVSSDNIYPLLLWGSQAEKKLAEETAEKCRASLCPKLTIQEVMALVHESNLLVSGDTFALQVACALSRPVVGFFGPTNPRRNGPFDWQNKVAFHEFECSYCYKRKCSDLKCLKAITPKEIADLCLSQLANA